MTDGALTTLRQIAAGCPPVRFRPAALFVAHCGVLTLVFDGFDTCILELKDQVDRSFPGLEEEHEGSMWPKVSLAVLKDSERLSVDEVRLLREVSDRWDDEIRRGGEEIEVPRLLAVEYGCRSLEVRRQEVALPLRGPTRNVDPPPHHARFVRSVLSQFSHERLAEYAVAIDREGHRETHYREPASGWSLVADVDPVLLPIAGTILNDVERTVPGKYAMLEPQSWHVTIRSLDRAPDGTRSIPASV